MPGIGALVRALARIVRVLDPAVTLLESLGANPRGAELRLYQAEEGL